MTFRRDSGPGRMFFSLHDQLKGHEARLKALKAAIKELESNPKQDQYQSKLFTHYEALRCEVLKCITDLDGLQKRRPTDEQAKKLIDYRVYLQEVTQMRNHVKNMPTRPAPLPPTPA